MDEGQRVPREQTDSPVSPNLRSFGLLSPRFLPFCRLARPSCMALGSGASASLSAGVFAAVVWVVEDGGSVFCALCNHSREVQCQCRGRPRIPRFYLQPTDSSCSEEARTMSVLLLKICGIASMLSNPRRSSSSDEMSSSERLLAASNAVTESMGTDGGRTLVDVRREFGDAHRVSSQYVLERGSAHTASASASAHESSQSSAAGFSI